MFTCLVCRIGERRLALPLTAVVETMRPLPIEAFPGTPPFVQGVATIRGAVLPVIDVGLLIGVENAEPGRFVTLALDQHTQAPQKRGVALAVDSVIGVQQVPESTLQSLPPLLESGELTMFSGIGTLDASLLLVLDHTHLMPDEVWASLTERVSTP